MANTIKVLMVKPGETSYTAEIGNNLRSMQAAVEGLIEVFPLGGSGLLVCNGEGKINSMPGNRRMDNGDIIAGPFFIARDNSRGGFASLTDRQMADYSNRFRAIEHFEPEQVQDALFMRFSNW